MPPSPNSSALEAYTMVLLRNGERYLLIQRAATKTFAPGRWTGVGGKVEQHEFHDLERAALRELTEETGFPATSVTRLVLRRCLLQHRPGHSIVALFYFTGESTLTETASTPEGELHWVTEQEISELDVIENTAIILPLLINDMKQGGETITPLRTGAAHFSPDGNLQSIVWSS